MKKDDKPITEKNVHQDEGKNISRNNTVFEKCIICHCITNVPVGTHIEEREFYVEGAGQLCPKCFAECFGKK